MRAASAAGPLERLAAARGVAVSYEDAFHTVRAVSPDTLVAVLAALGEPIADPSDAAECLARRAAAPAGAAPVAVAWEGHLPPEVVAHLAAAAAQSSEALTLELEDGADASELLSPAPADGSAGRRLPFGIHTLRVGTAATLIVSAPRHPRPLEPFSWGVFAPTYALWDERARPIGDLSCLARLGSWAGSLGAAYVATLPLLADYSSADAPGTVTSVYSPVSRMWWNEGYLDLARVVGFDPARDGFTGAGPAHDRSTRRADVAAAATSVRASLARMMARAHPGEGGRQADFARFQQERPDVARYAAFRAAAGVAGVDRDSWPERWIAGDIRPGEDVSRADVDLHVCAQWLTDEQVAEVAASTAAAGCRLMLDLPVGCRPDGYDTWAFPSSFAGGSPRVRASEAMRVGAPPDEFFSGGQDWGFRPLDPEGERQAGYPVVRGCLRHLLRHARALRIDHVLGFQRLWWIPAGAEPSEGTYVSYPADELLALACLEAWRHDATLIGEDLGTVDPGVRRLMGEHGIAGMRVAVFDLTAHPGEPLRASAGSCALVDTHDTATFAGWLDGRDIDARFALGLLDAAAAAGAHRARAAARRALVARLGAPDDPRALHAAVLEELGRSEAGVVIATLEDLWAEHDPQNIPGTVSEHANFTRRLAEPLAEIERDDDVIGPLRGLARARREAEAAAGTEALSPRRANGSGGGSLLEPGRRKARSVSADAPSSVHP